MGDLKRAQELLVDESFVEKLRESHDTIQRLNSQIQELQERVKCTNDSVESQDIESICSGKLFNVPSQAAVVPNPRSMLSRDRSMRFMTRNFVWAQGNVFGNPRAVTDSSQTRYPGILHTTNQGATCVNSVQKSTGSY